jgi:hypothetical protein
MQVSPVLVAALLGLVAVPAGAVTRSFVVSISNTGEAVLACDSTIAHWFSNALGEIEPGETLVFTLRSNPSDGTVFLRNDVGDDMPVQRVWCGLKGKSWATRAEIPLDRRIGEVPAPVTLNCASTPTGTSCAGS